jgi:hypothetical protein
MMAFCRTRALADFLARRLLTKEGEPKPAPRNSTPASKTKDISWGKSLKSVLSGHQASNFLMLRDIPMRAASCSMMERAWRTSLLRPTKTRHPSTKLGKAKGVGLEDCE